MKSYKSFQRNNTKPLLAPLAFLIFVFLSVQVLVHIVLVTGIALDMRQTEPSKRLMFPNQQTMNSLDDIIYELSRHSDPNFFKTGFRNLFQLPSPFEKESFLQESPDILPQHVQRGLLAVKNPPSVENLRNNARGGRKLLNPNSGETFELSGPYFQGLLSLAIPAFVVALVLPLGCSCLCCYRTCASVCGSCGECLFTIIAPCCGIFMVCGKHIGRKIGLFKDEKEGFTEKEIKDFRIIFALIALFIVIVSFIGIGGNADFIRGYNEFFDNLKKTVQSVLDDVGIISSSLNSISNETVNNLSGGSITVPVFDNELDKLSKSMSDTVDQLNSYVSQFDVFRSTFVIASFVFSLGFGFLCLFVNKTNSLTWILYPAGFFCSVSTLIYWVSYGANYPMAVACADLCVAFVDGNGLDTLSSILPCGDAMNKTVGALIVQVDQFIGNMTVLKGSLTGQNATDCQQQIDYAQAARDALARLAGCGFVDDFIEGSHHALCFTMLDGFITITTSQVLVGVGMFLLIPAMFLGATRIGSKNIKSVNTAGANNLDEVEDPDYQNLDDVNTIPGPESLDAPEKLDGKMGDASAPSSETYIDPHTGQVIPA